MIYYFSDLEKTRKTQSQFDKWVDEKKEEIKTLAYENRCTIDKRSIEDDQRVFDTIKNTYKPLKSLRKASQDYDALFTITKDGYIRFSVRFPITEQEWTDILSRKKEQIGQLGTFGSACVRVEEVAWEMLHEQVYKTFKFAKPSECYKSFGKVGYLVLDMAVSKFI